MRLFIWCAQVAVGSHDPVNFGALNGNSCQLAKDMNFKFGRHVRRDSPDTSAKNLKRGGWRHIIP